ncbi:MAG: hypothetical protein ACYDAY_09545 [Candidatus Dormibacteria bacterium]
MSKVRSPIARVGAYAGSFALVLSAGAALMGALTVNAAGPTCGTPANSTTAECLPTFAPAPSGSNTEPVAGAEVAPDWGFLVANSGGLSLTSSVTFQLITTDNKNDGLHAWSLPDTNGGGVEVYVLTPPQAGAPVPACSKQNNNTTVSKIVNDPLNEVITLQGFSAAVPAGAVQFCFSGSVNSADTFPIGFPIAAASDYKITYTEPAGSVTSEAFTTVAPTSTPQGNATSTLHVCTVATTPCPAGSDVSNAGVNGTPAASTGTTYYVQLSGLFCQTYTVNATPSTKVTLKGTASAPSGCTGDSCSASSNQICTDAAGLGEATVTPNVGSKPHFQIVSFQGSEPPGANGMATVAGAASSPSPTPVGGGGSPTPTGSGSPTAATTPTPAAIPTPSPTPSPLEIARTGGGPLDTPAGGGGPLALWVILGVAGCALIAGAALYRRRAPAA